MLLNHLELSSYISKISYNGKKVICFHVKRLCKKLLNKYLNAWNNQYSFWKVFINWKKWFNIQKKNLLIC